MTTYSTVVRATHLITNAAWFGGSLMGAVGLNPAAREGESPQESSRIADRGWRQWGPVQSVAIGLHLVSGLAIVADNRRRAIGHRRSRSAVVFKTALTGAAMAGTVMAYSTGAELGRARARQDSDEQAKERAAELSARMQWLQWVTPATTAGLLALDAYLGEQQRGVAGLLDAPARLRAGR